MVFFAVVVLTLGHEYFYNDESGEATWRRPRITFSKDSKSLQPLNSMSYNATQWTSPSKRKGKTDWSESDDQRQYQEQHTYDHPYAEQTGTETMQTLYPDEEVESLGDSSALTDDSRNMCFHVGQYNVDEDIYKVRSVSLLVECTMHECIIRTHWWEARKASMACSIV